MRRAVNRHAAHVERLRVHWAVHVDRSQLAKLRRCHIGGRQRRFIQILPGATYVIVIRQHGDVARRRCCIDRKRRRIAGRRRIDAVAHDCAESHPALSRRRVHQRITRGRSSRNICVVRRPARRALPLIAQRRRARGHHREGRRPTCGHRLIRRLRRNRRSNGRSVNGQGRGITRRRRVYAVAHDYAKGHSTFSRRGVHKRITRGRGCRYICVGRRAAGRALPLIAQRRRSRRRHRESRRPTCGHRLIRRLRCNRRSNRRRINGQGGCATRRRWIDAIAYDHAESHSALSRRRVHQRITRGRGSRYICVGHRPAGCALPLIAQRGRSRCHHRKGRRPTYGHRLIRRLRRNHRSDGAARIAVIAGRGITGAGGESHQEPNREYQRCGLPFQARSLQVLGLRISSRNFAPGQEVSRWGGKAGPGCARRVD